MRAQLEAIQANIVTLKVDAIVNAANTTLLDGAVSTAPFIAPRAELLAESVCSTAARPDKQKSPKATGCRRGT